ncbi:hypothetical protein A8926_4714 [Saccharopolyspora spinosa]|uniref:Uncharacterized protein n=1 Tax=Saccharopolyspora spinosa TaxID=60894 RepID=A0A2N3Y1V2_SACSN|nr:hypothetical protein A8926_4714 [Saccharopolyspora spinosa]
MGSWAQTASTTSVYGVPDSCNPRRISASARCRRSSSRPRGQSGHRSRCTLDGRPARHRRDRAARWSAQRPGRQRHLGRLDHHAYGSPFGDAQILDRTVVTMGIMVDLPTTSIGGRGPDGAGPLALGGCRVFGF